MMPSRRIRSLGVIMHIVKGKITRQINIDKQKIGFAIYIDSEFPDCPIAWTNELALELSKYIPIKTIDLLDIIETYLKKVGRINDMFSAIRYHDDVKLTNSFIHAFYNFLKYLEYKKIIHGVHLKSVKVNPSLYSHNQVSEGIVISEVPVALFEFKVKQ